MSFLSAETIKNESNDSVKIEIKEWLNTASQEMPLPIFHSINNLEGLPITVDKLLEFDHYELSEWWPSKENGSTKELQWGLISADEEGYVNLSPGKEALPEISYIAAYISIPRWMNIQLITESPHLFQVYVDGEKVATKSSSEKDEQKETVKTETELKLETGKHLLLFKLLRDPENKMPWQIKTSLLIPDKKLVSDIELSTDSQQLMTIHRLLDAPSVKSISLSANGKYTAIFLSQMSLGTDNKEKWLEIRHTKDGKISRVYRGKDAVLDFTWGNKGSNYAFLLNVETGKDLFIGDLESGTESKTLSSQEELIGFTWAPADDFMILSLNETPEDTGSELKRFKGLADRQSHWRNRHFLYYLDLKSKMMTQLTAGKLSSDLHDISHDGTRLIFSKTREDYSQRPYSNSSYYILHLQSMELDTLWNSPWVTAIKWSPDDTQLLITAGPSFYDGIGLNISEDKIPLGYDTQAYLYQISTKKMTAISKNFKPSIDKAFWTGDKRYIYFVTTDRSYRNLYKYDTKLKRYDKIDSGVEVIAKFQIASEAKTAIYTGSSANQPEKIFTLDLKKKKWKLFMDPAEDKFKAIQTGDVKRWTFKNQRDVDIEGRIYFPPNFDKEKKYPCIVYYYGGVSPVSRSFDGRYPKNLWAANGYIVYVMQPSGAVGFGQEFSSLHVNDWGKIVADEIIDGVKIFLDEHSYVDRNRVGSIGASYGGFMTMLLQTRTDIFAAAVSHAGISSISSYWGEGLWGYLYSSEATANSFPWNRKDIYIDQSPLFNADKISTPLLLLHGAVDTNVPPGESIQLYTALKLLNKEVEYIEINGQDHHILARQRVELWTKTIIAWFDRYLKNQGEWWTELYPQ